MKPYDPVLSVNNVGRTEPPATAHSGNPNKFPSCLSDLYEEYFADIQQEIVNAIEGVPTAIDGTDRFQLLQAIRDLADQQIALAAPSGIIEHISPVTTVDRTTITGGLINLPIPAVPAGRTSVIIQVQMMDRRGDEDHEIQIRDSNLRLYRPVDNFSSNASASQDNNTVFIDVTGASALQYNVFQSQGSPTFNDFRARIFTVGWI